MVNIYSRWVLLFSGNKKVYFEIYLLITTKGNNHLGMLLFSGNKKVYFEVVVTL